MKSESEISLWMSYIAKKKKWFNILFIIQFYFWQSLCFRFQSVIFSHGARCVLQDPKFRSVSLSVSQHTQPRFIFISHLCLASVRHSFETVVANENIVLPESIFSYNRIGLAKQFHRISVLKVYWVCPVPAKPACGHLVFSDAHSSILSNCACTVLGSGSYSIVVEVGFARLKSKTPRLPKVELDDEEDAVAFLLCVTL